MSEMWRGLSGIGLARQRPDEMPLLWLGVVGLSNVDRTVAFAEYWSREIHRNWVKNKSEVQSDGE